MGKVPGWRRSEFHLLASVGLEGFMKEKALIRDMHHGEADPLTKIVDLFTPISVGVYRATQ